MKARHARGRGKVRYEIGARINAMSYIGVVRELVSKLGLAGEINRRLTLLKRHLPYHESDHVLNIAYNLLCGGTRLEDLGSLRNNGLHGRPGGEGDPEPDGAPISRGASARGASSSCRRPSTRCGRGCGGAGAGICWPRWPMDVDGTLAPTLGDKKDGMDMSYKGVWGYHPLVISLANTGEVVNRPGNVVSHEGAAEWIGRSWRPTSTGVRATDFSLTANFDRWSEEADFIFGYDSQPGMVRRAKALEADDWERLERRPRYTSRTGKTRSRREDVKARIVRERGRQQAEDRVRQVVPPTGQEHQHLTLTKSATSSTSPPGGTWTARWSGWPTPAGRQPQLRMAALAWNLELAPMMMHLKADRRKYVAMEFRASSARCAALDHPPGPANHAAHHRRQPTQRGARSNGPASGSAATLPLAPRYICVRFAHAISSLLWLCGLQVRLMTRIRARAPRAAFV